MSYSAYKARTDDDIACLDLDYSDLIYLFELELSNREYDIFIMERDIYASCIVEDMLFFL